MVLHRKNHLNVFKEAKVIRQYIRNLLTKYIKTECSPLHVRLYLQLWLHLRGLVDWL
jgi:hypothetical protein